MGLFKRFKPTAAPSKGQPISDSAVAAAVQSGNAREDSGDLRGALQEYDRALALDPQSFYAHLNRGNALLKTGDAIGALAGYRTAASINPTHAGVHLNAGNALLRLHDPAAASAEYVLALALKEDYPDAHVAMACAMEDLGDYNEAIKHYDLAVALRPSYAQVHRNVANLLTAQGDLDGAENRYRRALQIDPDFLEAMDDLLFSHNFRAGAWTSNVLQDAKRYGHVVSTKAVKFSSFAGNRDPDRRLKIGLLSGDLRTHPVGYFIESVAAELASKFSGDVELIAYSASADDDAVTARIRSHCTQWRTIVGRSDAEVAHQIHDVDQIDILIDLAGHTGQNRLPIFAWRPAPIAVTWLGYFATTGVAEIQYLLADAWTLPTDLQPEFTEEIWYLPETRLCFSIPSEAPPVAPPPALKTQAITFSCFNNLAKLNDAVISAWARILQQVPSSRLYLKAFELAKEGVRQRILARFAAVGIGAERILLEGPSPRAEYFACYAKADIALDPFPYTGGTTTAEALWMGVPVLTLSGRSFLARQGVGLLMNAGMPDWIADSTDDYVQRAVDHAADVTALAALRAAMRDKLEDSPLFDAPRFATHFNEALRAMWKRHCDAPAG